MSRSAASSESARDATGSQAAARAVAVGEAVHLRVRPTGDAVAAGGLLARTARERDTPFHLRVTREPTVASDGQTVAIGQPASVMTGETAHVPPADEPCAVRVAVALREAGLDPEPVLAVAGAVAAGEKPAGESFERAERAGRLDRRPGVGVPTPDVAVGLASTARLRLPVSGDPEAARELLGEIGIDSDGGTTTDGRTADGQTAAADPGPEARRRLASLVALDATSDAPPRAVAATQRVCRPHVTDGPFGSVEGYAETLSASALVDPGIAVACAVDPTAVADAARDRWRRHGQRVHAALDNARTARYDGVFVCRVSAEEAVIEESAGDTVGATNAGDAAEVADAFGVLPSAARTAWLFHAPEPRALVVTDGRAAAIGSWDAPVGEPLRAASEAADGRAIGERRGVARFDGDGQAFLHGFREAVR